MRSDILNRTISFMLAIVLLFSGIPVNAFAVETASAQAPETASSVTTGLEGKTISILGDSISTYQGYSNGAAAGTSNSTIGNGAIYYPRSGFEVTAESTWWYQAAKQLGMEILVNNSWSGSCLLNTRSGTVGAYVDRCVQLHDDTGENAGQKPDIIAIFLGTNDYYTYPGTLGSYEAIDFGALITEGEEGFAYAEPATTLEAYAISLHKISQAYPDAEVYCFTLLPRVNSTNQPAAFNADVCQLAEHFGVHTVDLYDCGILSESTAFYMLMGDSLHPDNPGMDAITNAFVSALLKNSGLTTCDISFNLEGAVAMEGTTRTVLSGGAFEATLASLDASLPLEVTVTMDGVDITESCCKDNVVTIPAVTGNVTITAKPGQREPMNFRWETQGDALVSVNTDGNTENPLTMTHGTITDGVYSKTRFTMSQGISLRHDLPWCVEWKSSGTWTDTTDGALLFSQANTSSTADACYFYRRHKNDFFAFGTYTGGKYHNYGVKFAGTGIDTTAEHVFRMENRIASDGTNMVYLFVDDVEVGPMNVHYIGGTPQNETSDWISGKDFSFSYMGTTPHTIGGCSLEYVQIWENYHTHTYIPTVTAPTCTEQGYTTYTCDCGDSYVDDYTEKHSATQVTDAAIKANSLRPGLTEGSHCSACGAVLEPQEEIPAKGYDWMLEDGEFKLLLIGNSFSQDASSCGFGMTESQLYNMLQAMLGDDVKVTLGLLYSGGKGVHWYATQTEQGTKAPSFYTITPEKTVWTSRGGTSTETALTWTDWDVVTLQPYDVNFTKEQEGVPEKYKAETDEKFYPLETATEYMLDFIGTHAPQADVYCYMHWARSSATVASLNASLSTYQKFAAFYPKGLDYLGTETGNQYASIIPVGLSIQNARTTYLSELYYNIGAAVDLQNDPQIGLQRDGGHVTFNVGRYIAGLTFAEMLIPEEMRAEGYVLPGIRVTESVGKLPEEYTEVAQKAVFAAVESWRNGSLEVTNLEEYAKDPAVSAREELESMTLNLTCGDENALIAQIREKVLGALPAEFAVEAVAVDVEKNIAAITLRFGYTSVEAEMAYVLTDHNYENGACTLCGAAASSPYAGKTIACIGDSITYGVGVTKDQTDYVTLLAKSLEMDYIRLGASGTTLCTDGPRTCNIGKLTESNLKGADVVTIAMGINDFCAAGAGYYELGDIHSTDTSTIYGAARMWCERIVELRETESLRDTQFYFVTPVICSWNNSVTTTRDWDQSKTNIHGYTLRDLCNAIMEVAALYDVAVIDLNLLSGMYYVDATDNNTAVFGGDGVHPGEKGHEMMAAALANVLLQNDLRDDHDHSYGSWITTTWPTCLGGEQQRVCSVCSAAESRTLEAEGNHRYHAVVTAPTYTQQGYTTYTCSVCGDSYVCDYTDAIQPCSYRWEMQDNTMVSVTTGGNTANALTLENGSITNGTLTGVRYDLQSAVHLYHDLPWVIEWRSTGNWSGMLFGSTVQSPSAGLTYLFRDTGTKLFAFGEYNGSWNNYGIILDCDMTVPHVFRLENRIAEDCSNAVYLLVDGQEIDAMHHYYISGSNQNKNVNWANGKDIVFANIGTSSHPVKGMKLDYLQVWEKGEPAEPMALRYDDHMDMTGKTVEILDGGTPTSYQVGYGVAENAVPDTAVVTMKGNTLVATGIGTAMIRIDGTLYEVTVEAAPISLLLLIGQSNARGSEGNANQSIVCPDGMVYSTFGDDRGSSDAIMTEENAARFAPSALTGVYSTLNVEGTTEHLSSHPVNALTEAGAGKVGADSGLAYEWVRQTGEKVWIVNAAHGGTGIGVWQDDQTQFNECEKLFKACQETLRKEIAAGHYTLSHMGYFWCQGCGDSGKTAEQYVNLYLSMHESLKTELTFDHDSDTSTENVTFEFAGIIPVRASSETKRYRDGVYETENPYAYHESYEDIRFTGPRVAQYWMGSNPDLEDIWVVCNIGDAWVWMPDGTNGVGDYFREHYENGIVNYTTQVQQADAWYAPETPADVHDTIHYNQVGYNELGRECARNALILLGEVEKTDVEISVEFLGWDGYTEVTSIQASASGNSGTLVVPMITPIWKAKEITFTLSDGLRYEYFDLLAQDDQTSGTLATVNLELSVSVQGHEWSDWVTTKEPTPDSEGEIMRSCGICGLTERKIMEGVWKKCQLAEHLVDLPEYVCCDLNLWDVLEREELYYGSGVAWVSFAAGLESVTIPVNPGDKIYASSYVGGIRTTFFDMFGVLVSYDSAQCKAEFAANGGYLVVPEGAIAVNVPIYDVTAEKALYILNREHDMIKGICQACGKDTHTHDWSEWELAFTPAPGELVTEQRTCSICETSETRQVESVWSKCKLTEHYSELPEYVCCNLNLWDVLERDDQYFGSGVSWTTYSGGLESVTIPVNPGDQIYASSYASGIRTTFFDAYGVLVSYDTAKCKELFAANGGYLVAPEGAIAVNVPIYDRTAVKELYILNRDHIYENGICLACGAEHPNLANYKGKVISIMGDSISTFAGYIPVEDGFNREHLARYPQDNLLTDVNETWWMQVVTELDAKLGINESWRGSTLSGAVPVTTGDTGENAAMSNLIRIQNMGSNGTPDVILLYGGTNDLAHVSKVGSFDPATAPTEVDLTTAKWDNLADGFVHTLLRMRHYYPDAMIVALLPTYTASYYSDEKLAQGNAVMAEICEHYGIPYVDLRDSGVTSSHLPDGIHPGEEGMDLITAAVMDLLLEQSIEPGENVVYPVTHELTHVKASLGHYKGVSEGRAFVETLTGENLTVTVTMGGEDVTARYYAGGVISIPNVTGALVITAKGEYSLYDHLQQLPDPYCGVNLWQVLEHDPEYHSADGWTAHSSGQVKSITFPVIPGDRLYASSFEAAGTNGGSMNGIRVTFFGPDGVLVSMTADKVHEEFSKNGCLTVPEGATAVSIPMWTDSADWDVHFLCILDGHLQQIPEGSYNDTNLWPLMVHDPEYYSAEGWTTHSSGGVKSVTFPVVAGDRLYASSFGAAGTNGSTTNGIRVTYFTQCGGLVSLTAAQVYSEFSKYGYLTVPEGAYAVSIPMWTDSPDWELYVLTLPDRPVVTVEISWGAMEFTYTDGAWDPETHTYAEGIWTADHESNYITVANEGSVDASATFLYENAEGYAFTGVFARDGTTVTGAMELPANTSRTVWLTLTGRPEKYLNAVTIGYVTVIIQ